MSSSSTNTSTFTGTDVRKVVDSFAADFDMIAQATGLRTQADVTITVADVKTMATWGYLRRVDIVLAGADETPVRAASYVVSQDAALWSNDRPGNNMWPRVTGGSLGVVVCYSEDWKKFTEQQQRAWKVEHLKSGWGPSSTDLSYPGLSGKQDRRYASNAFGMDKTLYS